MQQKINFTTLNEGNSIFLSNKEKNIEKENNKNNNKSISQLYSKNFDRIKTIGIKPKIYPKLY